MLESTSCQKMSKSNLVAREDINPIDSTLETVEQLLNDIERQFLMNVTFSSDHRVFWLERIERVCE